MFTIVSKIKFLLRFGFYLRQNQAGDNAKIHNGSSKIYFKKVS